MAQLSAGFGLIEISPLVGTPLSGQLYTRYSTGVHDPLFARVLALRESDDDANAVMLIVVDVCKVPEYDANRIRDEITKKLPIPRERIWAIATHTHTGGALGASFTTPRAEKYAEWLYGEVAQAAVTAWEDLAPATVNFVRTPVDDVGFIRRFRMKDGTLRTNPGVGNPDIVAPSREARMEFSLVEFARDPTRLPIVLGAYPCHADVVGGLDASADYPGRVCSELTHRISTHPESLFVLGPCGDINHINVFGEERRGGHVHAEWMGRTLVDGALAVWDSREQIDGALDVRRVSLTVKRRELSEAQISEAKATIARITNPEDDHAHELVFAHGLLALAERPAEITMVLCALIIGDLAIVFVPGELFSELAERIEDGSPYRNTFCVELLASANAGYIGTADSYVDGGYETRPVPSSPFAPGTGEQVVEAALAMLRG